MGVSILKVGGSMPLHLVALVPSASSIGTFLTKQLKAPLAKGLGLDALSKAFRKAIECFLLAMQGEYESVEPLRTLLHESVEDSVSSFINSESVQELLARPFKDASSFDISALASLWREIPRADGEGKLIDLPLGFDWDSVGASYLNSVRAIVEETPELREIFLSHSVEEIRRSLEVIQGVPPRFSIDAYRLSVIEDFGTLKLSAIRVDCEPHCLYQGVSLQNVYVLQKVKEALPPRDVSRDYRRKAHVDAYPGLFLDQSASDSLVDMYRLAPVRQIQEVLEDPTCNRIAVLGDPGLGKSTLLEHLALNWAQGGTTTIPFLIELRKYSRDHARPKSFLEFLEIGTWSSCRLPQREVDRILRERDAIMLFDGLDEIFVEDLRANVVAEIIKFSRDYPRVKVIVTTRAMGYVTGSANPDHFRAAGFRHFTLQDFDDAEIAGFVRKWYMTTVSGNPEREVVTSRLLNAIAESRAIRELAGNPLLLTMMVLLNRRKYLPRERLKLYDSCAELLVEGWDAARHLDRSEHLTHEDKVEILQQIAFEMQQERGGLAGNVIPENKLKRVLISALQDRAVRTPKIVAEKIVDALAERDFMLCFIGDAQFAFVHRTFLEYFCAREFTQHLANAAGKDELLDVFRTRWLDDSWHEVIRLVCSMVGPDLASELIREMLKGASETRGWQAVFLASECVAEVRHAGRVEGLKLEIKERLVKLLDFHAATESFEVRDDADGESVSVRRGALDRIVHFWVEDGTRLILQKAVRNQYWKIRFRAVEAMVKHWKSDETRQWLVDLTKDESSLIVQAAVHGLAAGWPDERTRGVLLNLLDAPHLNVPRSNVIEELSQRWPDQTTWEWLVDRSVRDERSAASEAIRELSRRWQDERTRHWLLERVTTDQRSYVRWVAAGELVSYWQREQIKEVMLDLAHQNENKGARDAALVGLVRLLDPHIRDLIIAKLHEMEDAEARQHLIYDLVWRWPDEKTMNLLFRLAVEDENREVRGAAIHQLTRHWRAEVARRVLFNESGRFPSEARFSFLGEFIRQWVDAKTRSVLMKMATDDKDENLRQRALRELANIWPE